MKTARQEMILELVKNQPITTQEELAAALEAEGYSVTQATISRDIRELRLVKRTAEDGSYRYQVQEQNRITEEERHLRLMGDLLLSAADSGSLVVVKTRSGAAGTAAEAIDAMGWPEILGSLAGDNTILLVARTPEEAPNVTRRLRAIIR